MDKVDTILQTSIAIVLLTLIIIAIYRFYQRLLKDQEKFQEVLEKEKRDSPKVKHSPETIDLRRKVTKRYTPAAHDTRDGSYGMIVTGTTIDAYGYPDNNTTENTYHHSDFNSGHSDHGSSDSGSSDCGSGDGGGCD